MKTMNTKPTLKLALCALALGGLVLTTQAQTPLYGWNMNGGSGTIITPSAAVGGGGGLTIAGTGAYGGLGSGVSGAAGDLAFANNNTTYGGTAANSGLAASTVGDINIGVQTAFTMTGWIKADGGFNAINGGGGANTTFQRLFMIGQGTPDTGSANSATLALFNNSPSPSGQTNAIQLKLGNAAGYIGGAPFGTDGALTGNGSLNAFGSDWTFFAVSVDLTASANNVNFYLGNASSLNAPITATYTNSLGAAIGSIDFGTTGSALLLNRANEARGFDGWGDDFAFYSGALAQSAVDGIRLQGVPEPATVTMLGLGSLVGVIALRRRRS